MVNEIMKLADAYAIERQRTNIYSVACTEARAALEAALTAKQGEQEAVATVIGEMEHDGQGWCSKVRWLYNPVPVGETLYWEQPK